MEALFRRAPWSSLKERCYRICRRTWATGGSHPTSHLIWPTSEGTGSTTDSIPICEWLVGPSFQSGVTEDVVLVRRLFPNFGYKLPRDERRHSTSLIKACIASGGIRQVFSLSVKVGRVRQLERIAIFSKSKFKVTSRCTISSCQASFIIPTPLRPVFFSLPSYL